MTVSLLPVPDDPRFDQLFAAWPDYFAAHHWPRSLWLKGFEALLREFYPSANSDSLTLTARHAAGHDVP